MFDLRSSDGSVRSKRKGVAGDDVERGADTPAPPQPVKVAALDKGPMQRLHTRLMDYYIRELDRQADNRAEMAEDEDFYDNIQWAAEDAEALRDRGQMPLVYNVISAAVDWVTGTEKRARVDHKILPRRKEDAKPAERKTQLLKYVDDCNGDAFNVSRAFDDAVKVGIGWLEDGYEAGSDEEPLYGRYESWRNMLWDTTANDLDLQDGRYVMRIKWVDLDIACALFPQRKGLLDRSVTGDEAYVGLDAYGDEAMDTQEDHVVQSASVFYSENVYGYQRRRVRIIECWYRAPAKIQRVKGGSFSGEIFDPHSPGHVDDYEAQEADLEERTAMRMHVAIFTTAGMLWHSESPYRHNKFPFTPVWGYRRGRDGMPYGMIRRLKDIQSDINKRASKALHILSTNKVIMDEGALPDDVTIEDFQEEVARPDAIIVKKAGKELNINAERDLSQYHLDLMSRSISLIQQASGVTDENMGRRTNATSGIAIQRRQDQGALVSMRFFDNLLYARQKRGEKKLSLAEQFITEPKAFRITNMRGTPQYVEANDGLAENDIIHSKADFVIGEADWNNSMRQAAAQELLAAMQTLPPAVSMVMLDLVIENTDLPNREEIVRRIRDVTGQSDPDADENSPEEQQRKAAQAQNAQMQQASAEAEMRGKLAKAMVDEARAKKTEAEIRAIAARLVGDNVDAQNKAIAAAKEALMMPAAADAADHIMHEAGFLSRSEQEEQAEREAIELERLAQEQEAATRAAQQQSSPLPKPNPQQGTPPAEQPAQPAAPVQRTPTDGTAAQAV